MALVARLVSAVIVVAAMSVAPATAQQLDPKVVGFKLPDQIEWKTNPAGTNRSAVLQGDPSKPGPYAMLLQWLPGNMSRPHFHPNDRFFIVVSGTWWVGSGPEAVMCSRAIHQSRRLDRIISQRRGSAYTGPTISDIHPRELGWHGEGTALCPEFHHATDDPMAP